MRNLTALAIKWVTTFFILALWGAASGGLPPGKSAVIALFVAGISWLGDRWLPFRLQGVTRWAIDGGLTGITIWATQFLWPGPGIDLLASLVFGYGIGALELPLHFFLAARYGIRRPEDDRDGIR